MKKFILLCFMALLAFAANATIYVASDGDDANPGSDFTSANAVKTIAKGIALAKAKTPVEEVWVKAGTYTEVWGTTFQENNIGGVNIYGGFAGSESTLAERAKVAGGKAWEYSNETVVTFTNAGITFSDPLTTPIVIDGFSFKGGTTNTTMITFKNNVTIQNCRIENNVASAAGNILAFNVSAAGESKVSNCLFKGNTYFTNVLNCASAFASTTVENCVFTENILVSSPSTGTTIAASGIAKTYIKNCIIYNNQARDYVINFGAGSELVNSLVYNNTSTTHGVVLLLGGSKVVNSTIVNNNSHDKGGVFINHTTTTNSLIDNSVIMNNKKWGTTDVSAITVSNASTSFGEVRHCFFDGNSGKITQTANLNSEAIGVTQSNNIITKTLTTVDFLLPSTFVGYNAAKTAELAAADFGLQNSSPLIAAGDNSFAAGITLDLAGTKRIKGTTIDIGAYEGLAKNTFTWSQTLSVTAGNTLGLVATVDNGNIVYTSDDETIATISGTTLTGVAAGSANIMATATVGDATEYQSPLPITQRVTIAAAGAQSRTLTLMADPTDGGTVIGGGEYLENSDVTVKATANAGYRFKAWLKGSIQLATTAEYNYPMPAEVVTLTAKFAQVYPLMVTAGANGSVLSAGGEYEAGEMVLLTATGTAGYRFLHWTNAEGNVISTKNPLNYITTNTAVTLTANFSIQPQIIYLAPDGDDANDGTSWSTPKLTISTAITGAVAGDTIFMKAGNYTISTTTVLQAGVSIYGGFAGTETLSSQRQKGLKPWEYTNETVLIPSTMVFSAVALSRLAIVDGVSIKDGDIKGHYLQYRNNVTIQNCRIENNKTTLAIANLYVTGNDANAGVFAHCLVKNNNVLAQIIHCNPTNGLAIVDGCIFIGNICVNAIVGLSGKSTLTNSIIVNNGYVRDYITTVGANSSVVNCLMANNTVGHSVVHLNGGTVVNSTLVNNSTNNSKGGVFVQGTTATLYNSIISNNKAGGKTVVGITFQNATNVATIKNTAFDGADIPEIHAVEDNIKLTNAEEVKFNLPTSTVGNDVTINEDFLITTDFALADGSPLIGKGKVDFFTETTYGTTNNFDIEGDVRYTGTTISMGAYEHKANLLENPIDWTQTLALDMNTMPSMTLNAAAASGSNVSYLSANTQVATVSGNTLQAVSPGTVDITVYGQRTATYKRANSVTLPLIITGDLSTLTITPNPLALDKTATGGTVTLTSNYSAQMLAKPEWATVTPTMITQAESQGGKLITITPTANPTVNVREGILVFVSGGKYDTVKVVQAKGDPTLVVTPSAVTLSGAEGAISSVDVKSNTTWEVVLDQAAKEWVNVSPVSGTDNLAVTFSALKDNETGSPRMGTYTIKVTGHTENLPESQTVTLTQSVYTAGTKLFVDDQISASGNGQTWATAFKTIPEALDVAGSGSNIYIKGGKYKLSDTLRIQSGIRIYGSFAGTETSHVNRAKVANGKPWEFTTPTVIIPAKGKSTFTNKVRTLTLPMVIDGITIDSAITSITKLDKKGSPAGALDSTTYAAASALVLYNNMFAYNCIIQNSYLKGVNGVGVSMHASARLWNSLVQNNRMWLDSVSAKFYYKVNDHTQGSLNSGVGIALTLPTSGSIGYTPLQGTTVYNNFGGTGAGIHVGGGTGYSGITKISNCIIEKNRTIGFNAISGNNFPGNSGGGGMQIANGAPSILLVEDCLFKSNEQVDPISTGAAGTPGGAAVRIEVPESYKYFNRCIFTDNNSFKGNIIDLLANTALNVKIFNSVFYKNRKGACLNVRLGGTAINNTFYKNESTFGFTEGLMLNNITYPKLAGKEEFANTEKITFVDTLKVDNDNNIQGLLHKVLSPSVDKGKMPTDASSYTLSAFERGFLANDFNGVPRPQGESFDPGAFEYVKVKPEDVTLTWEQDFSNLDITTIEEVGLTATVNGVKPALEPYLLPLKYVSGDDLIVEVDGSKLLLTGVNTTNLIVHTNINSYYDTISLEKPVNVTGTGFLAVSPKIINMGKVPAAKAAFFRLSTDQTWTITGIPEWLTLNKTGGSAGLDTVWVNVVGDNSITDPRSAILTITAANGKTREVIANQDGLIFTLSTTRIDFESFVLGGMDVEITANVPWILLMDEKDAWLTVDPPSGTGNATILVIPTENKNAESRTAIITVAADSEGVESLKITVVQEGLKTLPPNSVNKKDLLTAIVYPNPTTNVLYVQTTQDLHQAELSLFSVQGTLVYSKTVSGNNNQIDMSTLPSGNYILKLSADKDAEISVKVLKQ